MSRARTAAILGALVLLTVTLAPVKYLAADLAGADLSAFRLALLAALVAAVVLAAVDPPYRTAAQGFVRTRFFLAAGAFSAWICAAGVHGFVTAPAENFERRAIIGTGSLLITVLVLPLVTVPALLHLRLHERLNVPARVWQALLAFAFAQVVLHLAGVPVNGIDLLLRPNYPEAPLFGLELLRPYSLFGEPRDLASLAVPLLIAGVVLRGGRRLTLVHGLVLGVLGVLLASYTFYLALSLFAAYYIVFERRSGLITRNAAIAAAALVVVVPLLSSLEGSGNRVVSDFGEVTTRPDDGPGDEPGDEPADEPRPSPVGTPAFNQAPDLVAEDYARDALAGDVSARDLLLGTGIGSFTATVNRYYLARFDHDLVRSGELVNTRLLPFGLLVEAGLVGLALLGAVVFAALRALQLSPLRPRERAAVRVLVVALLLASAVQTSVLFGVGFVICLVYAWRHKNAGALPRLP